MMNAALERMDAEARAPESSALLVVEDDPNDVLFIRRGLTKAGVGDHLRVARDGEEAIAYLKGEHGYQDRTVHPLPALMLLDLKLPRKTGLEVLEWLRSAPRFKDLPVVILSSSKEARDVARTRELGILAYYPKPVDFKELTEILKAIGLAWATLVK